MNLNLDQIKEHLEISKDKLSTYIKESQNYGYTEDALQNIESAISNIDKINVNKN
ncbi:MAG: hypothetical protein LKF87_14865 [Clostridium tyrobutyricum]|jgi:hypothetical protein|uniref:hypothetical protein n=1 Tax=Clostridium tyrobutyricum TaxID=1519 RepID=UPI00164D73EF|nr:hypothetical protein [Clostridium tyrobutyricum]MCH4200716.1 hypothetical protein [Clostridium tyrobutyricum]MCH4260196.1 hypothetical protein [Clostridium tyrobutyricum]